MMDQVIIDLLNGGGEDLQRYENSYKSVAIVSGKGAEPKRGFKLSAASAPLSYHDEVFIKDGEPTDDFLETMRKDLDLDFMNFESLEDNNDSKKEKTRASETPLRKKLDSKKRKMKTKLESEDLAPLKMTGVSKSSKKTRPEETQILSATVEMQNNFSDSNNILLEQQALIKSLQLRLVGALRTVKHLQTSLKHANSQIDDQGSYITKLNSKLKLAADRAMQMKTATDDERHTEFLMKEIDELKKRLKVAEIRIDEESSEKVRWEERCRNWRQCAEQAKQKLQVVESSIDIRVQTESKKNNKTSRRKVAEREEEITILRSQIQEYKTKLEREEIRCEEVLSRISKANEVVLELKEESRQQNIEIRGLRQLLKDNELQLQIATQKERVHRISDRFLQKTTGLQDLLDENILKSESVIEVQQSPRHRKTVPIKLLTQASSQRDRLTSLHPEAVKTQDNLNPPKAPEFQQPSLHSDTVALIKTIAARTVNSLPQNNSGAEIKVSSFLRG